jgi:tetratricopeptide (TPR) repeat protein
MVARLVASPDPDKVNAERLFKNLDEVYEYRSIEDENVFKDENMRRLVMNYGSGFVRAATYLAEQGEYERAGTYIERARMFIDEEISSPSFYTKFYSGAGQWDKLEAFVDNVIFKHPQGWRIYLAYVMSHLLENHIECGRTFCGKKGC